MQVAPVRYPGLGLSRRLSVETHCVVTPLLKAMLPMQHTPDLCCLMLIMICAKRLVIGRPQVKLAGIAAAVGNSPRDTWEAS